MLALALAVILLLWGGQVATEAAVYLEPVPKAANPGGDAGGGYGGK